LCVCFVVRDQTGTDISSFSAVPPAGGAPEKELTFVTLFNSPWPEVHRIIITWAVQKHADGNNIVVFSQKRHCLVEPPEIHQHVFVVLKSFYPLWGSPFKCLNNNNTSIATEVDQVKGLFMQSPAPFPFSCQGNLAERLNG
jgi:hypothetical protein